MSSNWRMTLMHVKTPADKIGQVCTEKERLTEIKRLSDQETQRERERLVETERGARLETSLERETEYIQWTLSTCPPKLYLSPLFGELGENICPPWAHFISKRPLDGDEYSELPTPLPTSLG